MKLPTIALKDVLYALSLLVAMGVAWGTLSSRVAAIESTVKEVSSVKEDIAQLKVTATRNYDSIKEIQKDMKQVLYRLPRR